MPGDNRRHRRRRSARCARVIRFAAGMLTAAMVLLACRATDAPPGDGDLTGGGQTAGTQSVSAPPGTSMTDAIPGEATSETEAVTSGQDATETAVSEEEMTLSSGMKDGETQESGQTAGSGGSPVIPDTTDATGALAAGEIVCEDFGLYTGQYVEDGSDAAVTGVIAVLLANNSGKYLDLATVSVDIDGETAVFVATGMPAGTRAWVMESSQMTPENPQSIKVLDCVTAYRDTVTDGDAAADRVRFTFDAETATLTAENVSPEIMEGVFVCYKTVHTDGNYLGGITYRVDFGEIAPGETISSTAGHFSEETSEIVRVGWSS
ncbi:MAG: hypothetical protein IJ449_05905 [Clostridia bacterium]|nr:hypothetical protein [Clostridia bacterium]